jgi:hypothetical protein
MKKSKLILLCIVVELMLIISVALANINPTPVLYFIFYNLAYGVVFSFLVPLCCLCKEKEPLSSVGIKKLEMRQFIVLILFVVFSIGGQLIPMILAGEQIPWHLLPMGIVPLIMTTFFEEFLFRGFIQGRIEQHFGWLPAIIISGMLFSFYHLGYPGFRTRGDILLLFAVGAGFAIAYKLSDNNLLVSYFVNLPNAFVTYMLKYKQFPTMYLSSTIAAVITLVLISIVLYSTKVRQTE